MKRPEQNKVFQQMQSNRSALVKTTSQMVEELYTHMPQALGVLNKNQYMTALQIEELKDTVLVMLLMVRDLSDGLKMPIKSIKEYAEKIQADRAEFQKMQEEAQKAAAEGKQPDAPTESQEPTESTAVSQDEVTKEEPQTGTVILTDKD